MIQEAEDFFDFFSVLRSLKTEHLVFRSMVLRLQAQSAGPGTRSTDYSHGVVNL